MIAHALIIGSTIVWTLTVTAYFLAEMDYLIVKVYLIILYAVGGLLEYCFLMAQCTDPGVMFRKAVFVAPALGYDNEATIAEREAKLASGDPIRRGAHIYRARACETCNIIRPPLASHCSTCDNCVLGFDHHCTFINNCVGHRNLKFFFAICWLTILWAALAVPGAIAYGVHHVVAGVITAGIKRRVTLGLPLATLGAVLFFASL